MFRKIGDGLRRFMAGRYGSDRLNQCLLGAAFVLILISAIGGRQVQWMSMLRLLTDKQYRYFRCPGCRQVVRVPRGKGKINIRCPKCSRQFIKKT